MAGPDPAIHVLLCCKDVDARVRGHDVEDCTSLRSRYDSSKGNAMAALTRRALTGGLVGLAVTRAGAAAEWPARTIAIIHGFPPGGPSDVVARAIADGLSKALGQSVIVESRPGASGTTAARLAASPPRCFLPSCPRRRPPAASTGRSCCARLALRSLTRLSGRATRPSGSRS